MNYQRCGVVCAAIFVFCTIFTTSTFAESVTIEDGYIGGKASSNHYKDTDVIGNYRFKVESMDVSYDDDSGDFSITITSNYFQNVGAAGTELGDLFISVDGWDPSGDGNNYKNDTMNNGEDWEYAVVLNSHTNRYGGYVGLYEVDEDKIVSSDDIRNNWGEEYRTLQEVQYGYKNYLYYNTALAYGTWGISSDKMTITLNDNGTFDSVTDFGFHWTMTCGNDVIEGGLTIDSPNNGNTGAAVPEPSTMALSMLGLVFVGIVRRKKTA